MSTYVPFNLYSAAYTCDRVGAPEEPTIKVVVESTLRRAYDMAEKLPLVMDELNGYELIGVVLDDECILNIDSVDEQVIQQLSEEKEDE